MQPNCSFTYQLFATGAPSRNRLADKDHRGASARYCRFRTLAAKRLRPIRRLRLDRGPFGYGQCVDAAEEMSDKPLPIYTRDSRAWTPSS